MLQATRFLRSAPVATLDWTGLAASLTTTEGKAKLARFRKALDEMDRSAAPTTEIKDPKTYVDWAFYKKSIPEPGLVEAYKSLYDKVLATEMKYSDTEEELALNKQLDATLEEVKAGAIVAKGRLDELDKQLAQLKNMAPAAEIEVDTLLSINPYLAEKVYADVIERKYD